MKKSLLTMAAALALVSCSQDDLMQGIENRPTGAIGVKAYVPTITRGTALNNEGELVKAENGFDLFAFLSDKNQFMGTSSDGVAFQGSGTDTYVWNYVSDNEMKFWSEANGSAIKFYAVSPMKAKQPAGLTPNITADAQTLTYTVPTTCSEQVDLMYAVTQEYASNDESAEHVTNGITLQFRHALSQIVFKAMTESELIYADIESVKITNLNGAGTFNLANAETYREAATDKTGLDFPWTYTGEANSIFVSDVAATTDINTDVDGNTSVATGKYTTKVTGAISLTESTEALLLLPQNLKTNGAALEISCKVRYKRGDSDIAEIVGSNTEYKTIIVPVTTSWEPGYKYTYTLIFTAEMGNPIKVKSVGVDEWNDAAEENVKVEGEEEKEEQGLVYDKEFTAFKIQNAKDLVEMRNLVNSGATYDIVDGNAITNADGSGEYSYAYATYLQTATIDLSTVCGAESGNWEPIGTGEYNFGGSYNGKKFEIKNIYVDDDTENNAYALFGYVNGAYLSDIVISGDIKSGNIATSIAVYAMETAQIINCVSSVNVTATINATGIVSVLQGSSTLQGCVNKGTITAKYARGIVDAVNETDNVVKGCYNIGTIKGGDQASGIIGSAELGTITSCYNAGELSVSEPGGLIGGVFNRVGPLINNRWVIIECCYYINAEKGITTNELGDNGDKTFKVDGVDITWDSAATEMNLRMPDNLRYSTYTGDEKEPLTF